MLALNWNPKGREHGPGTPSMVGTAVYLLTVVQTPRSEGLGRDSQSIPPRPTMPQGNQRSPKLQLETQTHPLQTRTGPPN